MPRAVDEKKAKLLLEEPIRGLIPKMAVPTIVAQLITTVYNIVDTFFVSSLGTNATAAVGVNSSLDLAITLFGMPVAVGAGSYIARLLGGKDREKAHSVFSTSMFFGMLFGVIVSVAGLALIRPLVLFLGANADCVEYSVQYGTYVLTAAPFMIMSLIMNQSLRSEGSAALAMVGIGFGGVLNCVLDPIMIFGLNWGVAGASIATAISKFASFCILCYPYIAKKSVVRLSAKYVKLIRKDIAEVLSIGSSSFFRASFSVVASTLMNRVAGAYSTSVLAAISVSTRVMNFPFAIILGFGQGYQPVAGYNWGAKRYDRAKESFRFASMVSLVGAAAMGAILFIFAGPEMKLFNKQLDAELMGAGIMCIQLQCAVLPIHAWLSITNMLYAGIGKPMQALALSTARQGYCFWPLLYLLPRIFGAQGLVGVQAAADAVSIAVALPLALAASKLLDQKYKEFRSANTP